MTFSTDVPDAGPSRPARASISSPSAADPFASLPKWDPASFEPPAWASRGFFGQGKDGGGPASSPPPAIPAVHEDADLEEPDNNVDGDENWQDALEQLDLGVDEATEQFTMEELKRRLARGIELKTTGNQHFTARPPRTDEAIAAYKAALDLLPTLEKGHESNASRKDQGGQANPHSGLKEISDDEAAALQADADSGAAGCAAEQAEVECDILDARKGCLGNLGACYLATEQYTECVDVCSQALMIEPRYTKALQRRGAANEKIGKWSSLESAQEDYRQLLQLLPASSPVLPSIRKALDSLPARIAQQQEKDKEELMALAKNAGNTVLGWFGMSLDNIKLDQQPGGGYGVRIER